MSILLTSCLSRWSVVVSLSLVLSLKTLLSGLKFKVEGEVTGSAPEEIADLLQVEGGET